MNPYSELNHLDSALMYYDPNQDLESVISSLENCFPPSFLAVKEEVKTKIEGLMVEYMDRISHPEKYGVKQNPIGGEVKVNEEEREEEREEEDEREEEAEVSGNEELPTISSLFKKQIEEAKPQEASSDTTKEESKPAEEVHSEEDEEEEEEFNFSDAEKNDMEVDTDSDIYIDSRAGDVPLELSSDSEVDLKRPFGAHSETILAPSMNSEQSKRCCIQSSALENPQCTYYPLIFRTSICSMERFWPETSCP